MNALTNKLAEKNGEHEMNTNIERRNFATSISVRSVGGKNQLMGRAAAYGKLSENLGNFREILAPGAFARAVREKDDALFTVNHDSNALPLGRVSSGTLRLYEDLSGLMFQCDLPNTSAAADLVESINRKDISECSFAFAVDPNGSDDTWSDGVDEDGIKYPLRTINNIARLFDCSAVARPAYSNGATHITAGSFDVSSNSIPDRVLVEARARGGYVPRVRIIVPTVPTKFELHQRSEAIGKKIAEESYNAELADYIKNRPRPNSHVKE